MKTLADVAELAGVSQATVSRAINGKPGVSEQTRENIREIMKSLGMATGAQRSASHSVAIVSPDLSNPIFSTFTTTISTLLASKQILPLLCTYTATGTSEDTLLEMAISHQIDGVIFLAGKYDTKGSDLSIYHLLNDHKIPAVYLNEAREELNGYCIMTDDAAGVRMALNHLKSQGHKNIGLLLGDPQHLPSIKKYEASLQYAQENDLNITATSTVWTTYGFESGRDAALQLIDSGITALVCASDQLALGAMKAIRSSGLSVPADISVIGYDDSSWLSFTSPTLTTVRQNTSAMAGAAVRCLTRMIEDPTLSASRHSIRFEPELVVRESTAIAPNLR